MNEAQKFSNASMIGAAGIAVVGVNAAMGAAEVGGVVIREITLAKQAGDQGWDVDGNFVCSKFIFNYATMQVFDGTETHDIEDIVDARYQGNWFSLSLKGRKEPKLIKVGNEQRGAMIAYALASMWNGLRYEADEEHLLAGLVRRSRIPRMGTLLRYGVRALLLGLVFLWLYKGILDPYGSFTMAEYKISAATVFVLSLAWRLLRPITLPKWRPKPPTKAEIMSALIPKDMPKPYMIRDDMPTLHG